MKQYTSDSNISSGVVVLDFYADWCQPCHMVAPLLEELSSEIPEAVFYKVNVDEEQDLSLMFGIRNIPTVIVLQNGTEVSKLIGANPKNSYESAIKETLN